MSINKLKICAALLVLLFPATAFALSQGPFPFRTFTSAGASGQPWANPGRASSSDQMYASTTLNTAPQTSRILSASNTNPIFSVPSNATITGIQVDIEKRATTTAPNVVDASLLITQNNAAVGTDHADLVNAWTDPESTTTYGNSGDLWGVSWTPAQINSSGLGLRFQAKNDSSADTVAAMVDYMRITVFYSILSTTPQMQVIWLEE